jgi:purine-binding chemotaxis protein CheW
MTNGSRDACRVCVFEAAGRTFAVRLDLVREVVAMAALSRPASMPPILEGILNLRGTAVPVVRLAALLDLPQDALDLHTALIVMRGDPDPFALVAHRVSGIAAVAPGAWLPLDESQSFNGCVEGQITVDGRRAHVLSPGRLLLEKESRALAAFQAAERNRLKGAAAEAR